MTKMSYYEMTKVPLMEKRREVISGGCISKFVILPTYFITNQTK